jgi:plastocyanin
VGGLRGLTRVTGSLNRGGFVRGVAGATLFAWCLIAASACAPEPAGPPPPPPGAIPAGQSIGNAAIEGRVRFDGAPPPRRPIRMSSEASCQRPGVEPLSEDMIVAPDGGLKNVYVRVVAGLGDRLFAPPASPAVMDQAGCAFAPHVLDVQAGQVIEFANSDPIVHNVRAIGEKNRVFNISMPGKGKTVRRYFAVPEIVKIRCDIHAWMAAFIAVEGHPFHAVTGDDGAFVLKGLPAGTYTVEAWQEKLGTQSGSVTIKDGETGRIDFTFHAATSP